MHNDNCYNCWLLTDQSYRPINVPIKAGGHNLRRIVSSPLTQDPHL